MIRANRTTAALTLLALLMPTVGEGAQSPGIARKTLTISGRVGVPGATMQGLPDNPVSDENGVYSARMSYGWSGAVTPVKLGYQFEPSVKKYTSVTADLQNEDYKAGIVTFIIAGRVGAPGVTLQGLPDEPISNQDGSYSAKVPFRWAGMVVPTKEGYRFDPPQRTYTPMTADQNNEDYVTQPLTFTISGNAGLAGVTMQGLPDNTISDENGVYNARVPYRWSGKIKPTKLGYTFRPQSRGYESLSQDYKTEDYDAEALTFTISGNAGLAGVTIQGLPDNIISDENGAYSAKVLYGWSGTVAPAKTGYVFEPSMKEYASVIADLRNQDFVSQPIMLTISDVIRLGNEPLVGVRVTVESGGQSAVTDTEGRYTLQVPYGWSGLLTLAHDRYEFDPPEFRHAKVTTHIIDKKFVPPSGKPPLAFAPAPAVRVRPVVPDAKGGIVVIPTTRVIAPQFAETSEDMRVMLHILREKLSEPRMIMGVLYDYGDFFDSDQSLEAVYLQGYGALFVMQSDLPFALPPESPAPDGTPGAEAVDPVWQRARQRLYAPPNRARYGGAGLPGESREMDFDGFLEDLLRTLRHAANIRHLDPNEYVIVTIIARDRGTGRAGGPAGISFSTGGGGWFGGGSYGFSGGSSGSVGGSSFADSRAQPRGSTSGPPRAPTFDPLGSPRLDAVPAGAPSPAAASVLTVQVRKADIDAFAQGALDFGQFQQKVRTFTY